MVREEVETLAKGAIGLRSYISSGLNCSSEVSSGVPVWFHGIVGRGGGHTVLSFYLRAQHLKYNLGQDIILSLTKTYTL